MAIRQPSHWARSQLGTSTALIPKVPTFGLYSQSLYQPGNAFYRWMHPRHFASHKQRPIQSLVLWAARAPNWPLRAPQFIPGHRLGIGWPRRLQLLTCVHTPAIHRRPAESTLAQFRRAGSHSWRIDFKGIVTARSPRSRLISNSSAPAMPWSRAYMARSVDWSGSPLNESQSTDGIWKRRSVIENNEHCSS